MLNFDQFEKTLNDSYKFPTEYLFKFVVPKEEIENCEKEFSDQEILKRDSKKGNYIGVSFKSHVQSATEIIAIYKRASKIKNIISL